jgi:hypothetical protein
LTLEVRLTPWGQPQGQSPNYSAMAALHWDRKWVILESLA